MADMEQSNPLSERGIALAIPVHRELQMAGHDLVFFLNAFIRVQSVKIRGLIIGCGFAAL